MWTVPVFPAIGLVEVVDAMKAHPHYDAPLEGPNTGVAASRSAGGSTAAARPA